ncbi:DUF5132 domain-containing protein [Nitrospira sp. Nam74]
MMSLWEDMSKSVFTSPILVIGAVLVAPTLVPALGSALRPLAKAVVKAGVTVYDSAKDFVAEAGEEMSDMVAEARAEMVETGDRSRTSEAGGERATTVGHQEKRGPAGEKQKA